MAITNGSAFGFFADSGLNQPLCPQKSYSRRSVARKSYDLGMVVMAFTSTRIWLAADGGQRSGALARTPASVLRPKQKILRVARTRGFPWYHLDILGSVVRSVVRSARRQSRMTALSCGTTSTTKK